MDNHEQRREHIRRSLSYSAHIVAGDASWVYPCEIFDVSAGGAKLAIYCPPQTPLARQFFLQLSEISQANRYCEVAWRQGNEIGVRFIRAPHPAPDTSAIAAHPI